MVDLSDPTKPVDHPALMSLLLKSPDLLSRIEQLTASYVSSIFYSQVAFRTPLSAKQVALQAARAAPDYSPGAEYHLDGTANSSGTRFPDPWSILVGIALVDITTEDRGNFTVFPGWHTSRDWSNYPEEKRTKTLPDLGTPTHVCLRAGDAVIAHVLLPHRGGKNASTLSSDEGADSANSTLTPPSSSLNIHDQETSEVDAACAPASIKKPKQVAKHAAHTKGWDIPPHTREMVFFRVRVASVDYESPLRGLTLLSNPWSEFPGVLSVL